MPTTFLSPDDEVVLQQIDALRGLRGLRDGSIGLLLTDPPWNTGTSQRLGEHVYHDSFTDFKAFLYPILQEMHRVLQPNTNCIVHMGHQEAHNVKVWLDEIFGKKAYVTELVAHHEAGRGTTENGWAVKHSYIFVYRKGRASPFHYEFVPAVERKAAVPGYASTKKCNSVIPATLVTTDSQRVGYPSQKPLWLYEALVRVYSDPGAAVCDPFAGSGTTGDAAHRAGRMSLLFDTNPEAVSVIAKRLGLQQAME